MVPRFFVLLFAASTVQKRKKRQRDEVNHLLPHDDPIVNEKGPFVKYGIMMSTMMAMADDDGVVEALSGVAALVRFHHGRANLILNFVSPISIPKGHCGIALFNEQTGSCSKGFLSWWRWFFLFFILRVKLLAASSWAALLALYRLNDPCAVLVYKTGDRAL